MPRITYTLPRNAQTLYPATQNDAARAVHVFRRWESAADGRFIIASRTTRSAAPTLTDRWQRITTLEGVDVEIRRAACGGGCRCAGEFRFPEEA